MPQIPSAVNPAVHKKENILTVALAGNPNSGKSTVFNALTKLRQKVGNYPGVTVEKKVGRMVASSDAVNILDLPGTYSLAVRSPDEQVARDVLLGHMKDTPRPDIVVCVVDASNLERNLYLVSQILDLGLPVIIALNMMDAAQRQGFEINPSRLANVLGIPVVPMIATRNEGIEELKKVILRGAKTFYKREWRMPELMEQEAERLTALLCENSDIDKKAAFSEVLVMLSREDYDVKNLSDGYRRVMDAVWASRRKLSEAKINWRSAAVEARYAWIQNILIDVVKQNKVRKTSTSDELDKVLTHRFWGWAFFVGLMALMFFTIFSVASYPMGWIDSVFVNAADQVKTAMPAGDLRDLLTDGIIAGVGAVVVFLPQILILFFFIGLLQDTGYMARAAFIMDKLMNRVGLHGKSFIPLLSSFACAIPGIMATRSIESPKDRLVTILVAPLMSCSARLPVYTLLIATLIPNATAVQKAGLMLSMYFLGIIGAFVMAWFFKKTLLKSETPVFIMELPPYRLPSLKSVIVHMWERSRLFLKRAGTVIFGLSIILWALMTYPKHEGLSASEALKNSFAGKAGVLIEPLIKPLGYDWRVGIGLIGSFAAREVFVSTMNIVFNIEDADDSGAFLQDAFRSARWPSGKPLFTPLACISLMVFYVYAMQCVSTVAIVRRETNSWRWPIFQIVYMSALAYLAALMVFQGGRLLGWQ